VTNKGSGDCEIKLNRILLIIYILTNNVIDSLEKKISVIKAHYVFEQERS